MPSSEAGTSWADPELTSTVLAQFGSSAWVPGGVMNRVTRRCVASIQVTVMGAAGSKDQQSTSFDAPVEASDTRAHSRIVLAVTSLDTTT